MSYNGSGTFAANSAGLPVVASTVISTTMFNAMTADLATGLSTAICKDGQTTTTAVVPFAAGISAGSITNGAGLAHGTYTPTLTGVANVDSSAVVSAGYIRLGSMVIVFLQMTIDPTNNTTLTQLGVSLPVASNFSSAAQAWGDFNTLPSTAANVTAGGILSDAANDRVQLEFVSTTNALAAWSGIFAYQVI